MLRLLDVQPGQRVLDVGSGSGWTTALLGHLVGPNGHGRSGSSSSPTSRVGRREPRPRPVCRGPDPGPRARACSALPARRPWDRILVSAEARRTAPAARRPARRPRAPRHPRRRRDDPRRARPRHARDEPARALPLRPAPHDPRGLTHAGGGRTAGWSAGRDAGPGTLRLRVSPCSDARRPSTKSSPRTVTTGPQARPGAKNRPTPKRREQEALNKRPLIVTDRKAADEAGQGGPPRGDGQAARRHGRPATRSACRLATRARVAGSSATPSTPAGTSASSCCRSCSSCCCSASCAPTGR